MKGYKSLIILLLICQFLSASLPVRGQIEMKPTVAPAKTIQKADDSTHVKSAAYEWLDVALEATAREHDRVAPRPTVGSRMLMIITTSMYDAWAAYDDKAVGTRLGDKLRRPQSERTEAMFRPPPPPKVGSEQMKREVDEVLMHNASLTLEQKAIVEFMRDGPRSTGQSGHWLKFAQAVSLRDKHDVDKDVKMFFAVGVTAFDAFIAAWEAKRFYDSARPWTLIRHYYKGQKVRGWSGAGKGVAMVAAEDWHPYSPLSFITPPFPGYVSGHSAVSAASAKTLELFTGSDFFGATDTRHAGELTEPGISCEIKQSSDGKPGAGMLGDGTIVLKLPTFSATAEMAGLSRVMGGYHIQADNVAGLELGRKVSNHIFPKIKSYFDGTAGEH